MQSQFKKIIVPKNLGGEIAVAKIHIANEQRVYRDDVLFTLRLGNNTLDVRTPYDGWVKHIVVKHEQHVAAGETLCLLSVFDTAMYRTDESEVNLRTELGESGRRGLERDGQRKLGEGYDKALFEAPSGEQGNPYNRLKENPHIARMKEGVPPKMSASANQNTPAVDHAAEEAARSPELQAKLSHELKQQLNIQPGPSNAPTLSK